MGAITQPWVSSRSSRTRLTSSASKRSTSVAAKARLTTTRASAWYASPRTSTPHQSTASWCDSPTRTSSAKSCHPRLRATLATPPRTPTSCRVTASRLASPTTPLRTAWASCALAVCCRSTYMDNLQEEEEDEFKAKFAKYVEAGVNGDDLEDMYLECHKAIRANPAHVATKKNKPEKVELKEKNGIYYKDADGNEKFIHRARHSIQQRKNRVAQKKAHVLQSLGGDDEDSD